MDSMCWSGPAPTSARSGTSEGCQRASSPYLDSRSGRPMPSTSGRSISTSSLWRPSSSPSWRATAGPSSCCKSKMNSGSMPRIRPISKCYARCGGIWELKPTNTMWTQQSTWTSAIGLEQISASTTESLNNSTYTLECSSPRGWSSEERSTAGGSLTGEKTTKARIWLDTSRNSSCSCATTTPSPCTWCTEAATSDSLREPIPRTPRKNKATTRRISLPMTTTLPWISKELPTKSLTPSEIWSESTSTGVFLMCPHLTLWLLSQPLSPIRSRLFSVIFRPRPFPNRRSFTLSSQVNWKCLTKVSLYTKRRSAAVLISLLWKFTTSQWSTSTVISSVVSIVLDRLNTNSMSLVHLLAS